jgi:phage-related protein
LDVLDDFLNGLGGVIGFVLSPLKTVARWLWDHLVNIVQGVIDFFSQLFNDVVNTVWALYDNAISWADDLWQSAVNIAAAALADLRNWAYDAVNNLIAWTDDILKFAEDGIAAVTAGLDAAVSFIENDLIAPLQRWIDDAAKFVAHIIGDALSTFYHIVIAPLVKIADDAWHKINDVYDFIVNELRPGWDVIAKAWDWIVWLSEHSFSIIEDDLLSGPHLGPRISRFVYGAAGNQAIDGIGDYIDKVLS